MNAFLWCVVAYALLHVAVFAVNLKRGRRADLKLFVVAFGVWASYLLVA